MKRPNIFYQITLGSILKLVTIIKGQKIIKKTKIKGPAIVLSNHTSFYDFMYTFSSVYPRRVNFVAARKMFNEKTLKTFMNISRAIPKSLMESDPSSIKNILKILKKNGIISIFPEGQISPTGQTIQFNKAITKLIAKANVDVYIVKHLGAGLQNPSWSKKTFKGKVLTEKYLLFKKEDLVNMTLDDIYNEIYNNLYFSIEDFNKEYKFKYKVNDITNLNNLIYLCDTCNHEGLNIKDNKLVCPNCQKEFVYDNRGFINNIPFNKIFDFQQKIVENEINNNKNFSLKATCSLHSIKDNLMQEVGSGTITLDINKYLYEGTINNEFIKKEFDPINIPYLPSDIGRNIQIYDKSQVFQFELDNKWLPTKFVHAGQYIHKINI